jgi:hypothetical protein
MIYYRNHEALFPPDRNCTLWRYMDLTKFLSILETRTLHFARADQFDDPYEGRLSQATVEKLRDWAGVRALGPDGTWGLDSLLADVEKSRGDFFINCWCAEEHESAAMWRLYLQSREGVAIRTDHDSLVTALAESPWRIGTSLVQYVDYETTPIPNWSSFSPFVHKGLSFSHEHELRVMIWAPDNRERITTESPFVRVEVEPNQLIKAVHVSPTAQGWFGDLVEALGRRYDLNCQVVRSKLYNRPIY